MFVRLSASTDIDQAVLGAKMCYGAPESVSKMSRREMIDFIKKIIKMEHESVLEHCVFVFEVFGISRACLQELARHRHISLSVKSTRWAMKKHSEWYTPLGITSMQDENDFNQSVANSIVNSMEFRDSYGNDVAKYMLPECVITDLIITVNLRELRHMYKVRTSEKALKEFQDLMRNIVKTLHEDIQEIVVYNPQKEEKERQEHTIRFLNNLLLSVYKNMEYDSNIDNWVLSQTRECLHTCNGIADYLDNNGLLEGTQRYYEVNKENKNE